VKKIGAIIQARTGSTRLHNKVLKDVAGKSMLWHVVNRIKKSKLVDTIIIATTDLEEDKVLLKLAEKWNIDSYAGSENDVLDRYFQASIKYKLKVITRITADCPLIDPHIIDRIVEHFLSGDFDYVSNTLKPTYPDGLDTEVFSFEALKRAWKEAKHTSEREHVTPYIWKHPEKFKLGRVKYDKDLSYMRWSVDEEKDLEFVKVVYKQLYKEGKEGKFFYMEDVLDFLKKHPEMMNINKMITRNEGYLKSLKEDKLMNKNRADDKR